MPKKELSHEAEEFQKELEQDDCDFDYLFDLAGDDPDALLAELGF